MRYKTIAEMKAIKLRRLKNRAYAELRMMRSASRNAKARSRARSTTSADLKGKLAHANHSEKS